MLSNREIVKLSNTYMRMKQTYCFFSTFAHRVLTVASARAKLLTFIALCLFFVGNVWGVPTGAITAYEDIMSGSSYYIGATVGEGDYYLSLGSITIGTGIAGSKVSSKDDATIFKFIGSNTSWTIQLSNGNYLALKQSKDNGKVQIVSTSSTWTLSNSNSLIQLKNGNYCLQANSTNTSTNFGSYASTQINVWLLPVASYTVTAVAYPTDGGSVSVEGNKITATPNTGWQISTTNPPYTVTDGTATVEQEQSGNEFTVTPSSNCTVQINFEKKPTYTLTYYVGNTSTEIEVAEGANILEALKDITPTSCDATSTAFIGWTTTPINGKQPTCPKLIAEDATITSKMTVYAVFAKGETTSGGGKTYNAQKVTSSQEVVGDAKYIIEFNNNHVAIGTTSNDALQSSTTYQLEGLNGTEDYIWIFRETGSNQMSIWNNLDTKAVNNTNSTKIALSFSLTPTQWAFAYVDTEWKITNPSLDNRFLGKASDTTLKAYATSNWNSTYRASIQLYKLIPANSTTYTDYMTACEECEELGATWGTMEATNVVRQTATLSWGMSSTEHVAGYSVHVWSTSSTVYNETFTVDGAATTTLNLTDLLRETTYNWTVTAITESGWCTTTSDAQQFVTIGAEQLPAPTDLQVVYQDGKYTFSWKKVENATEYKMTNAFSSSTNIKGTSSERTLDLIPGDEYTATVQAIGDGDNYTNSETASVTFTAHTYTLTLSVTDNGTTTTKTFTLPKVTLPSETSMCEASEGWTFAGWSETDIAEESTTTAPALIAAGIEYGPDGGYIKKDRTLYAVFSKTEEGENAGLYYLSESNYYIGAFDGKYFKAVSTTQDAVAFGIEDGKYLYAYVNGIKTYYSHTKSGETDITSATTNPKEWTITETGTTIQLCSTAQSTRYLGYSSGFRAYAKSHTLKKLPATTTLYTTSPQCTDCDAPHNLWASATADAVTIVWEAASPTATVKIYSDEAGTIVFTQHESEATENHQCRITGLEQNKKYWYRVFSAGNCGSAIASFTTESKDISIVEWEKEAVIVDINTEVADGVVSVVVEKRVEHGEHNYADDLFFSKYYEATGDVKLLGIYNGTPNTVSLSGYKIYIGKKEGEQIGQWDYTVDLSTIGDGVIEPNEEILLWRHIASDNTQVECIKGKIDVKNMIENSSIIFGGRNAIVLSKDNVPIDVMGGISEGKTMDDILPANCTHEKPSWGDQSSNTSWNGWGYSIEDPTQKIELSMNRCLLVRRNHVKSGKNAVEKNRGIAGFLTLGNEEGVESEWLGRQVPKGENDWQVSCEGFAYVAGFDYNNYYTTYEKMDNAVFNGTPNENGTYTITVPNLPQLACTDIRLQLTKNGEVTASVEQKVPIIVTEDANTTGELFSANGLTPEICKTCDVVVRDKSRLTHATGQNNITEFRNMYIYHDSELEIAAGTSLTLDKLRMFALNDSVSYAIINNTNDAGKPTITVNEVSHVKRIDGRYWYPFSLPYDCYISQISALNGKSLGKYGTDWCIKYYNGEQRQKDGTSASLGQVSQYWEKLGESDMLEAYKGYIIGLYCPTAEEAHQKSVHFAPARQSVYTETGESKTTDVHNWPDNLEAEARHHGWNFTGSPYISLFGVNESGDGLFNDQLKMGYTDKLTGEQKDKEHVYLSIPDGKDRRTYTQVLASATTVKPFTAYFVQTIDPNDGMGQTLHLTYQKARRTFPGEEPNPTLAPRRAAERDAVLFAEINLTDNAAGGQDTYLRDNTGVLVSDRFSADYEIGDDLTKMYAAAGKPQLYTMAGNEKMAYNALPDGLAHNLPLGIYVPKAGEYTLSLNRHASRLENAEAVYLLHSGIIVADLLLSDYTILATAKGEQTGYMLDIRRATKVVTGTEQVATDEPYAIMCDGQLTIGNLPTASDVAIYDALGRLVWSEQQATTPVVADLPQTGVYMVLITSGEQQYVLKSLNR